MWMRDSPALRNHDGFNAHWEIDRPQCSDAWSKAAAPFVRASEIPGTGSESSFARPLGLLHTPLCPSRPAGGYEPSGATRKLYGDRLVVSACLPSHRAVQPALRLPPAFESFEPAQ
jgi:hypothetical protein